MQQHTNSITVQQLINTEATADKQQHNDTNKGNSEDKQLIIFQMDAD
jgi:hypothetical protein